MTPLQDRLPGMCPFNVRCPEIAPRETYVVTIQEGFPLAPAGEYAFVEFYCTDPRCDCRRVLLQVWAKDQPGAVLATINYGWEKLAFYEKWTRSREHAREIVGASLDPLNTNGPHADAFLCMFRDSVRRNPAWSARFRRHYKLFKNSPDPTAPSTNRPDQP